MLPNWLTSYFTFHKKERNGSLVLLAIIAFTIAYNIYLRKSHVAEAKQQGIQFGTSIAEFNNQVDSLDASNAANSDVFPSKYSSTFQANAERFTFNPNTLDSAGWVRLGFSPKQSASIIKYTAKGGSFKKPEDLLRLYMMDSALYLDLLPWVHIPAQPQKSGFQSFAKPLPIQVDLNLADTVQLSQLKGIGPTFARRICKYRKRLGGFRNLNQLYEIFGMDSARVLGILPQLNLDTTELQRININTADFKQLIQNPYINKNQVNAILNYREQHGPFRSTTDIKRIHLISPESFGKLSPYFKVN
jgi:DNA uptake protein ComE-like DNA-binding protein